MKAAAAVYEEALALDREQGRSPLALPSSLINLARASISLGLGDRARGMLREAICNRSKRLGSKRELASWSLDRLDRDLRRTFGEWEFAARLYGATRSTIGANGLPPRARRSEAFLAPAYRANAGGARCSSVRRRRDPPAARFPMTRRSRRHARGWTGIPDGLLFVCLAHRAFWRNDGFASLLICMSRGSPLRGRPSAR